MLTLLKKAIYSGVTGSSVNALVGGRVYAKFPPPGTLTPYLIISVVSINPEDTFKSKINEYHIQFTGVSSNSSEAELNSIYAALLTAMDSVVLTVTGATQCLLYRENTIFSEDDIPTAEGTEGVARFDVDYSITLEEGSWMT